LAEKTTGGRAIEANVDDEKDALTFKVQTVKDGAVTQLAISGASGKTATATVAESDSREKEERGED